MDPHLLRLEQRLDSFDAALRGDPAKGIPGVQESQRALALEVRRQGEELALLRTVPQKLEEMERSSLERDEKLEKIAESTNVLALAARDRQSKKDGDAEAMERVAKWLKIAVGAAVALGLGGGGVGIALLRELSGALP